MLAFQEQVPAAGVAMNEVIQESLSRTDCNFLSASEGFTLPERFPFSLNPPVAMKPEKTMNSHLQQTGWCWCCLVFLAGENESACPQKAPGLSAPLDHQFPVAPFCFSLFPFVEAFRAWVHICESVWMFPTTGTLLCVFSLFIFFERRTRKTQRSRLCPNLNF